MATSMLTSNFGVQWPQNITGQGLFPMISPEGMEKAAMKRLLSTIGIATDGTALINSASIAKLQVNNGKDIEINDVNLTALAANHARLNKVKDANVEVKRRLIEMRLSEYSLVNVDVVSTMVAEYVDTRNIYALMKDEYITEDDTVIKTEQYVVVTGFKYAENHKAIFIPAFATLEDDETNTKYPITKIISTKINGQVIRRLVRNGRMNEEEEIPVYPPVAIIAPHITDIDLTYDVEGVRFGAFFRCPASNVYMGNLEKIIAPRHSKLPVFCGMNNLSHLHLPKLVSVKNAIFASNNADLQEVDLSSLKSIIETVFLANCPRLEDVSLPSLELIRGCDYFCFRDISMRTISFPMQFAIRPHKFRKFLLPPPNHWLLGIQIEYKPCLETTAMQYFLHGCASLMNAFVKSETKAETTYNAPFDLENVSVQRSGIHFIHRGGKIASWKVIDKDMYGSCICSLEQLCNEQHLPIPSSVDGTTITPAEGSDFTYMIESTYKTLVDGSDKSTVLAIDFRTALFNDIKKPRNSKSPIHLFNVTSNNRFAVNATAYSLVENADEVIDLFEQLLGDNQYYNFGFTE